MLGRLYFRLKAVFGQLGALVEQFVELNGIVDEAGYLDLTTIIFGADRVYLVGWSTELSQLCTYDMARYLEWLLNRVWLKDIPDLVHISNELGQLFTRENHAQFALLALIELPIEGITEQLLHDKVRVFLGQVGEDRLFLQLWCTIVKHVQGN